MRIPIVLTLATLALAGGSFGTPSTHIWGPSTDIQPPKLWHIGADMYIPVNRDDFGNRIATVNNLGLTVGVLPGKKVGVEVGFDYRSGMGVADDYPLYLNGKVGIPEDALGKGTPAIAAGLYDFGTKKDVTTFNILYVKAAKTIPTKNSNLGRVSLGYFTGNSALLLDRQGRKDNSGVMAAWERSMNEISDRLWLCVEYMGTESLYGCFNIGSSWRVTPSTVVLVGYDIYNNSDLAKTLTFQVDIDI